MGMAYRMVLRMSLHPAVKLEQIDLFCKEIQDIQSNLIIVTNEVGSGVIPESPLGRKFIDELGSLNQSVARICDQVILMVSGIPQWIKGERNG